MTNEPVCYVARTVGKCPPSCTNCARIAAHVTTVTRELDDMLVHAWGVIANAFGGDWSKADPQWRGAAESWRDAWLKSIQKPGNPTRE